MQSPDRINAWLGRAVRVRTFHQLAALGLVLLVPVVLAALLVPGPVAATVAIGALAWFAVLTVLAFLHARGPTVRGGDAGLPRDPEAPGSRHGRD
ncbi:MAG TPA: hypothetical protein VF665_18910 [Longimicrobium sp.]|jgi:hypothetical protein|uniref:hypothetical protein n=1 Tax=Longimicrobium sp. TaxID=2029185 RepID=UPI002ED8E8FE